MKKIILSMGFAALALGATAQVKIKDGTVSSSTTPNSNAILELESTQRGLLYPRVALSSTSSASPLSAHIKGMVVYDTVYAGGGATAVTPGVYYNDGTQWVRVVNSSANTNTAFVYGTGTPAAAGASCSSTAQNTIYTDTGNASATRGQTWICDGTTWQNYSPPAATEWYVAGTGTDAGASKTADISHTGILNIYHGNNPTTAAAKNDRGISLINDNTGNDIYDDISSLGYGSTTPAFLTFHAAGNAAAPANLANGVSLGRILFIGYSNNGWNTTARFDAVYTGNGTTNTASIRAGGMTDFSPISDGASTLGTSSLRWGTIYSTSGVSTTSDIRLKKDIEPLTYGLNQIMQIEPISYNLKSGSNGATKLWGVSAQQVQNILPDVVNVGDDENKTLGVRYDELIPVLINAVKELKAENDLMQQQIQTLKAGK